MRAEDLLKGVPQDQWPGVQTRQLLYYYFPDPRQAMLDFVEGRGLGDADRQHLQSIHFLHTERLNADLHAFLKSQGFDDVDLEGLLEADRIFPPEGGRALSERGRDAFSPEQQAEVEASEALLYEILPEYAPA